MKKIKLLFYFLLLNFAFFAQLNPTKWDISAKKVSDCEYDVQFKASIDETWHLYSLIKYGDDGPNQTILDFKKSTDYKLVGKPKETTPKKEFDKVFEMTTAYHEKSVVFTQRIKLLTDKAIIVKGFYDYQVCTDSKCNFFPGEKFEVKVQGSAACINDAVNAANEEINTIATNTLSNLNSINNSTLAAEICECVNKAVAKLNEQTTSGTNTNPENTATETNTESSPKTDTSEDTSQSNAAKDIGGDQPWWLIFLNGLGWGLAAVFTPCVFPLIPLNVSFFLKRSETPKKGKRNAMVYVLSIIAIFLLLGTIINAFVDLNSLSTGAPFNLIVFVLLLIFAASFLGAFEIILPSSLVNKIDQGSDKGGFVGIFFMALTLVVVSFSCTGVMVSNALVLIGTGSSFGGPILALLGFAIGLAFPFGLFALFPSYLTNLPKSGGWLNAIKVTLGFLELALALKFASNVDLVYQLHILSREVFISLWIVIFALMTIYLMGGFKTSHDSDVKFLSVTRIFIAILSFFVTIYLLPGLWGAPLKLFSGILPPVDYSESPKGFMGSSSVASINESNETNGLEISKTGIKHFKNDYDGALAYAKKVNKPLLIDFTGRACANCRKTEDYIWTDERVKKKLNEEVVLVSLYVDDRKDLPASEIKTVKFDGKDKEITTIGEKFKFMEYTRYHEIAQPLYIIVNLKEENLNSPRGYKAGVEEYIQWMDEGISKFK
jgi:thiol:disulfide interchange protein